jgi:2-oxoglutarate ferredoxin oxidoreductase subunit delta
MSLLSEAERYQFPDWDNPTHCVFHAVTINTELCDGCGLCVRVCPGRVLELHKADGYKQARVKDGLQPCISCNDCHAICPNSAIGATKPYDFVGFYRQLGRGEFSMPRKF